jgi:hypothetical protein
MACVNKNNEKDRENKDDLNRDSVKIPITNQYGNYENSLFSSKMMVNWTQQLSLKNAETLKSIIDGVGTIGTDDYKQNLAVLPRFIHEADVPGSAETSPPPTDSIPSTLVAYEEISTIRSQDDNLFFKLIDIFGTIVGITAGIKGKEPLSNPLAPIGGSGGTITRGG